MGSNLWGAEAARAYDATSAVMFDPTVLDPTVDMLSELANGGPALEFATGTGRVAFPLAERGIDVQGVELSPDMADQLRSKPNAEQITVTVGDMTSTRVAGEFNLIYLVWNGIMNVTDQDGQIAIFENAFRHLAPGGRFVVEVIVPQPKPVTPGELGRVFTLEDDHVGIETFDDIVGQIAWSHHWMSVEGRLVHHAAPYRYVWPSELDLMARFAGFELQDRWADWSRTPFTADSENQVAVFERATI